MKCRNEQLKINKEDHEKIFYEYRDINEEKMNKHINKKLGQLPIDQILQQLSLNDLLWNFNSVSLYPAAMSDEKSNYTRIETGHAFTPDMNNNVVEIIKPSHKDVLL